jgi:hypothetical protein
MILIKMAITYLKNLKILLNIVYYYIFKKEIFASNLLVGISDKKKSIFDNR